jgi:hydrophobic/amphiphilic exporter-1 (mainly G- bacteria), HAE1 family
MSLPRLAIKRPVATAMFFLAVALIGGISLSRLAIDLLPDIAYPKLVVYTSGSNRAPMEMERFVTRSIESQLIQVPGVENIESVSREGQSLVTLRFKWGTNMDFAMLNVREKLDNITLPDQMVPSVLRTDPSADPIMSLSVASAKMDVWELKGLAETVVKRRLEQIAGIAQASVIGGVEREIHVDLDPRKLESYGIELDEVKQALNAANESRPGGIVKKNRLNYALRTVGEFQAVGEIRDVVVRQRSPGDNNPPNGQQNPNDPPQSVGGPSVITVKDIANVDDGARERESITRYNGTDAIGLLIYKEGGANTVEVTREIYRVLNELRTENTSVRIDVATSQAEFIDNAISNVIQNVWFGGILAFLVLFLFLRDPRYPVAIAIVMPICIIATFALFDAADISLNIMSLGGLALGIGLLMDNSIVVVENIFRHRERGLTSSEAAAVGTEEVQRSVAASTLTTMAVFGPIIYVQGIAGQLFKPLSLAVAFALGASVLVAVGLLPMMAARWREPSGEYAVETRRRWYHPVTHFFGRIFNPGLDAFDRAFFRFTQWYERLLDNALHHRVPVILGSILLLVAATFVTLDLKRSVLPMVDQGQFQMKINLPRGTSLTQTSEEMAGIEKILKADPGVEAFFTRIGRRAAVAGGGDENQGVNSGTIDVRLKDGVATKTVIERLRPSLSQYPAGVISLTSGQATGLGSLLGANDSDFGVRLYGDSLELALATAEQISQKLSGLKTVNNVHLGTELGHPEMRVDIDRERAATYNLSADQIAVAVEGYMNGTKATEYLDFDRKIPVIVRLPDAARTDPTTLDRLRVQKVPLRQLVSLEQTTGPSEIRSVGLRRAVIVYADATSGSMNAALADVDSAVKTVTIPKGLQVEIGGENEEMRKSFRALAFAMIVAVMLVYMILAAEFESLLHPFIVMFSVPMGLIGAAFALWITGAGLNAVSLIGVIVLVGIVDNDAVVKVDFINQMRRKGLNVRDAIRAAGHARLRPILINTITALLGLLPMALGIGPGAALQAPLAIAVFGGLITSTALTLVVLPVIYDLLETLRLKLGGAPDITGRTLEQAEEDLPASTPAAALVRAD